jgi:ABC-type multidrug transport system ATPase subunit
MSQPRNGQQRGLQVTHLTKTYAGGVRALDGVDLAVQPGLYGLLGPNGAGKSTLMRTLATLQTPDSGSITLDGVDVLRDPDHVRRRLGYLPQQIGAYPGVSGRSLLERFAWLKGRTDRRQREREISELLERVNLSDAGQRAVATYSGGMLRRFGIALALLGAPRLIIVDEPTAGLDPAERNRFHRVLADVAADAIVLLSTHIVEDVENLCERLSILDAGRVVAEGTPAELTASLVGRLWARTFSRGEPIRGDALHVAAAPTGNRVIVAADRPPSSEYVAHAPRLEDYYHHALARSGKRQAA